jgi:hypothetical protein
MTPKGVALGGVMAGRHWNADFDLHGTPRLDLVVHSPRNPPDLTFLSRLDPALRQTQSESSPVVLAIHVLQRAEALFEYEPGFELPWADPVETTLDLYELRLSAQANELLARFRPEVRLL